MAVAVWVGWDWGCWCWKSSVEVDGLPPTPLDWAVRTRPLALLAGNGYGDEGALCRVKWPYWRRTHAVLQISKGPMRSFKLANGPCSAAVGQWLCQQLAHAVSTLIAGWQALLLSAVALATCHAHAFSPFDACAFSPFDACAFSPFDTCAFSPFDACALQRPG